MDFGDRPGSTDGSRYFYLNQEIMRCYLVQFSIQLSRFEDDQMASSCYRTVSVIVSIWAIAIILFVIISSGEMKESSIRPFCQKAVWKLRGGLRVRCRGRTFKALSKRFGQRRRLFVGAEAKS